MPGPEPVILVVIACIALVVGAFLLLWRLPDIREWTRARRGHCLHCGFDRHDLAPRPQCPECGEVP